MKPPQGQKHRWLPHDHLLRVEGTVVIAPSEAVNAPHAVDEDARPFAKNPSLAAPRRALFGPCRQTVVLCQDGTGHAEWEAVAREIPQKT